MYIPKFNYLPLNRETIEGKRNYCLPDGSKVASVTTILDATKSDESKEALANWRKAIGHQKAQTITTEAAGVGTVMHKMLEEHCLGKSKPPGTNNVQKIAYPMAQTVINQGLIHVNEVWGNEVSLYFPGIYAGTTDCVGLWKGKPAVLDFKQTNKPKKSAWVDDYRLQLVAYGEAHNEVYGTNIQTGVILMCSRNCEYQEFVVEGNEWEKFRVLWWKRVEQFYQQFL